MTLAEWLTQQEQLTQTSRRIGMATHTPSYQLGIAVRIIRAMLSEADSIRFSAFAWDHLVEAVEKVLQEKQKC